MFVTLTVPIMVEGYHLGDFEAAAELQVIDIPHLDWKVEKLFVDVGVRTKPRINGRSYWISQFLPCPGTLSGYIEDYMDTEEGRIHIEEQIMENRR